MRQHRERCRALPPLARGETERLLKAFVEAGGTIKACPTRYALQWPEDAAPHVIPDVR